MADQVATNGVVHVISRVMYPLPLKDNVVDVVRNTSSLSTLYKAIKATGVSDIIAGLYYTAEHFTEQSHPLS